MLIACACVISQVEQSAAKIVVGEAQRRQEKVELNLLQR